MTQLTDGVALLPHTIAAHILDDAQLVVQARLHHSSAMAGVGI
jgi:hypothetical protein